MKHDIRKQLQRPLVIFRHKRGIHAGILFGRVRVQLAPHVFQTAQYMIGFSLLCSLENNVLDKMSHPELPRLFIPASHVNNQPAIGGFIRNIIMDQAQSIWKYMCLIHFTE